MRALDDAETRGRLPAGVRTGRDLDHVADSVFHDGMIAKVPGRRQELAADRHLVHELGPVDRRANLGGIEVASGAEAALAGHPAGLGGPVEGVDAAAEHLGDFAPEPSGHRLAHEDERADRRLAEGPGRAQMRPAAGQEARQGEEDVRLEASDRLQRPAVVAVEVEVGRPPHPQRRGARA